MHCVLALVVMSGQSQVQEGVKEREKRKWEVITVSWAVKDTLDNLRSVIANYVCGSVNTSCGRVLMRVSYNKLVEAMVETIMQDEMVRLKFASTLLSILANQQFLALKENIDKRLRDMERGTERPKLVDCDEEPDHPLCRKAREKGVMK